MKTRLRKVRRLYQEKGPFLLSAHIWAKLQRSAMNRAVARQLRVKHIALESGTLLLGLQHIEMGENFSARENLWIEAVEEFNGVKYAPRVVIKDNVNASRNVHIGAIELVEIGAFALIGSNVLIVDHNHGSYSGSIHSRPEVPPNLRNLVGAPVVVGDRVWLGDGVVVCPGATIGNGTIVGANSVVLGSIPPNCIVAGSPAKVIKRYSEEQGRWVKP